MTDMATARYYPHSLDPRGSKPLDGRSMAYLAVAVAALSAVSVFLMLCERDHSFLVQASQPEHQASVRQPLAAPAPARSVVNSPATPHAANQSAAAAQPDIHTTKAPTGPEYLPFVIQRSKHFQRLGPISIGLWRTDPKHGTYDVSLIVDGHRFDKERIGMDEALAIRIGNAPAMELLVNRIGRNDISGYLSKPRELAAH